MIGLGSSNTLGLGIVMTLDDQVSQAARKVTDALGDVDTVVKSLERIDSFGQGMSDFGFAIAKGLTASVQEFARFEDIMNSVKVISADQGLTDADFQAMNDQVRRLGEMYGVLPEFVAEAQLELAKAGKKPLEIMAMTEATMALGAATDTLVAGTNGAAEVLVNIMQAFNASASEADRYSAAITSAANQSTIDVKDFFQSLRYSADISRSLGIGIEEVAASIATLGNAGLKGSIAGTSYANMLRYLAKAMGQFGLKRQQDALDLLGITKADLIDETTGSLKSMSEILQLLRRQYVGMDPITRLAATQGVFGVRGDRAAQPLIQGIMESNEGLAFAFEEMSRRINNDIANNVHLEQANNRLDDLMGDWNKLTAAWSNLKIAIGSGIGPALRPITRAFTRATYALTDFFNTDLGKAVTKFTSLSSIWLIVFGKGISFAARFYTWMITSAGKLTASFKVGTATANVMNKTLVSGSATFLRNITLAANKWVLANRKAGIITSAGNLQTLGPTGMRGKGAGRPTMITALFGLFGKGGLRAYAKISQWFVRMVPWVARVGTSLSLFGRVLGRVFSAFFGWPAIIADIVLTLTTGKGVLEWLWEGAKYLGSMFMTIAGALDSMFGEVARIWGDGSTNFFEKLSLSNPLLNWWEGTLSDWAAPTANVRNITNQTIPASSREAYLSRQDRVLLDGIKYGQPAEVRAPTISPEQRNQMVNFMENMRKTGNTQINLTINAGDGQTKKRINVDQERSIQSYSIN